MTSITLVAWATTHGCENAPGNGKDPRILAGLALGYLDSNQEQLKRFSVDRPNAAMGRIPRISAVLIAISVRVSTGAYGPNLVILQGSRRVSGLVEGHARSNRFASHQLRRQARRA